MAVGAVCRELVSEPKSLICREEQLLDYLRSRDEPANAVIRELSRIAWYEGAALPKLQPEALEALDRLARL